MVHRKLRILIILFALIVISNYIPFGYSTDAPDLEWEKTFGGTVEDYGMSVQVTDDGGYIITGSTTSAGAGGYDVYLVKTDSSGTLVWERTYGGNGGDESKSVTVTGDGGYVITGFSTSYSPGGGNVYLVMTNSSGSMIDQKVYGGSDYDIGESVQVTGDGGFIITGMTQSSGAGSADVYLVKTDSSGTLVWEKTFGGTGWDYGYSVQVTSDGGYIITGYTQSSGSGSDDVYLVKTDSTGTLVWEKTFGGTSSDYGEFVQVTGDGGYIITGTTLSSGAGQADVYLVKTDSSGTLEWETTFGGTDLEYGHYVQVTDDGGYIITGSTGSSGAGEWDVYLVKTDSEGNLVWETTYGGSGVDYGYSVQVADDGGYIITGITESYGAGGNDVYLVKTSPPPPQFAITPRKNVFYTGDTVSFDISHSLGLFDPIQGSIVVVKNAQGQFVWLGDPMNNWLPNGDTYVVPISEQTAKTNPFTIMQDSSGGIWTYDWIDTDDNVIESGQFRVRTSRVKNFGRFLARIYDLLDLILDLLNNLIP